MEEKIISMLEQIMEKLDEHGRILGEHTEKLDEHSRILGEHTEKLDEHSRILGEHTEQLTLHGSTLEEHGQLLSALVTGQEHLKAEIEGMKISNAKEFGSLKENMIDFSVDMDLLRDETWENKKDIHRIKNTMGMS